MVFWNRGKKEKEETATPFVARRRSGNSKNRFPVEVKVLAARARESGLGRKEVADLIGASLYTVDKWHQMYQEGGPEALLNQSSSPSTRRICSELERRIETYRRENPEAGVRLIRDELRREEGLAVSEETVKIHRGRVMQKLEIVSVAELVRLCEKAGIAPAEPRQ